VVRAGNAHNSSREMIVEHQTRTQNPSSVRPQLSHGRSVFKAACVIHVPRPPNLLWKVNHNHMVSRLQGDVHLKKNSYCG